MTERELLNLGVKPYDDSSLQLSFVPPPKRHEVVIPAARPSRYQHRPLTGDEEMTLRRLRRVRPGSLSTTDLVALRISVPMKAVAGLHECGYPVKRNKDDYGWYFWIEEEIDV